MPDFQVPDFFTTTSKKNDDLDSLSEWVKKYGKYVIFAIFIVLLLGTTIIKVDAGERAVIFNVITGVEKRVLGEGIHLIIPFLQSATIYDVKHATYSFTSEDQGKQNRIAGDAIHSLTSDGQRVDVELSVRARPTPSDLWKLHKEVGPYYPLKIIYPKTRSVLREILSSYPVEDVYSSRRQEIQNKIQDALQKDLAKKYFIEIEEVLIRNVKFSKEFQDAIDRKQQAFQEYLRMEYVLASEKAKRDAKILQAEGEAQAINLRVNALKANPYYIKYRKAQVYGKRAKLIFSENLNE